MIRVMIVDDHQLFVDALRSLLEDEQGIEVTAIASSPEQALATLAQKPQVDIILMDISFHNSEMDGMDVAEKVYEEYPHLKVLILTASNNGRYIARMLRQKISGYMLKNTAARELVKALNTVNDGDTYYGIEVMKAHMDYISKLHSHGAETVHVTKREREVLQLLVEGKSTQEIGEELHIGEAGVETHRRNLRNKFKVKNTAGLIREAILQDLVDVDGFKK
ncbi:MAG: response regulator transcription factor [Bacteroidia bacterium]|nr:response regulator transcription factor [Bacteroidia bacterium]